MGMKEAKEKLDAAAAKAAGKEPADVSSDDIELKRKTRPPEDDANDVEIDISDDDDAEEGGDAEEKEPRSERRRRRGEGLEKERLESAARAEQERIRADRLEASLLEVTRRLAPKEKESDPFDTELKDIEKRLEGLAERAAALGDKITPEQEKAIRSEATELRRQEGRVNFKIAAREDRNEQMRRSGGVSPEETARNLAVKTSLETEFRDVYSLSRRAPDGSAYYPALNYAKGEYTKRNAGGGLDLKLLRDCLKEAEKSFGLGNSRDVSSGQRAKFSGVPRGGHGGGEVRQSFTMTPEHRRMANSMYKHIKSEPERFKLYAKKIGKKIMAKSA